MSPIVVGWCLEAWGDWDTPLYTVAALYRLAAFCWLGIDPLARFDAKPGAATPVR